MISGGTAWRSLRVLSVLFTGTLAGSVFAFTTQLLLARLLAPAAFGRLAALLAIVNFFTPVAAAGANWFFLQAFGREGWTAVRWLRPTAMLLALTTSASVVAVSLYAWQGPSGSPLAMAAAIAILLGQVAVELASARLQLTASFGGLALWQVATQTGRLAVVFVVDLLPGAPSSGVLAGYAAVGLATTLGGAWLLKGLCARRLTLAGHGGCPAVLMAPVPSVLCTAREAMPFALVTMFYVAYFQGAIVVLEWLNGGEAAATFNAAFLVISAISLIPQVVYMKFLMAPLCRWAVHDRATFSAAFHVGVIAMGGAGLICMLGTLASAAWLMPLLFGPRYAASAPVLAVLALGIPLRFVGSAYGSLFLSPENTVRKARYLGIAALCALVASLALIPALGVQGAAVATVLAEAVLLVLHVRGTARFIDGIAIADSFQLAMVRDSVRHLLDQTRYVRA